MVTTWLLNENRFAGEEEAWEPVKEEAETEGKNRDEGEPFREGSLSADTDDL